MKRKIKEAKDKGRKIKEAKDKGRKKYRKKEIQDKRKQKEWFRWQEELLYLREKAVSARRV